VDSCERGVYALVLVGASSVHMGNWVDTIDIWSENQTWGRTCWCVYHSKKKTALRVRSRTLRCQQLSARAELITSRAIIAAPLDIKDLDNPSPSPR